MAKLDNALLTESTSSYLNNSIKIKKRFSAKDRQNRFFKNEFAELAGINQIKVLVITSFYPPYHIGGYELRCEETVNALKDKGLEIQVLTSYYGLKSPRVEDHIYRLLDSRYNDHSSYIKSNWFVRFLKEFRSQRIFKDVIRKFQPDKIYVWHNHSLYKSLHVAIKQTGIPVIYDVSDTWLLLYYTRQGDNWDKWFSFWRSYSTNSIKRRIKAGVQKIFDRLIPTSWEPLDLSYCYFTSHFYKQKLLNADIPVNDCQVIHTGINLDHFPFQPLLFDGHRLNLLYVGRIHPDKGLHIALDVLQQLTQTEDYSVSLTVAGRKDDNDYYKTQLKWIQRNNLDVKFIDVPRKQIADIYHSHHILIFPVVWDEPFSRTLIEAMACGCLVIASDKGSNGEIIKDGINGLIADYENFCKMILSGLLSRDSITNEARKYVEGNLTFNRYFSAIYESCLIN